MLVAFVGCADRRVARQKRRLSWVVVQAKRLELDKTYVGEVEAPIVVVVHQVSLSVTKDDECV